MARQQNRTIVALLALLLIVAQIMPVSAQSDSPAPATGAPIRVGAIGAAEGRLLSQLAIMVLSEAGYAVDDQTDMGAATDAHAALETGQIDLYIDFTGVALTQYNDLPVAALPNVAERVYELAKTLDEPRGITWLDVAPMNSSETLLVTRTLADQGIASIEDLTDAVNRDSGRYTICVEGDFYGRADGLLGLESAYDLRFPEENILIMEGDEVYANLRDGLCEVAQGHNTDGRIAAWDLVPLTDSHQLFHYDQPAVVVRTELLDVYPELPAVLDPLMTLIDTATMRELNQALLLGNDGNLNSGDEAVTEDLILGFLVNNGLVKPAPIRVGSKEFTEQLVLGKLMVLLLRDAGFEVEDLTGAGGTAQVRQMVEAGQIDIYPEYTGTATSVHHGIPVTALPTTAERAYVLAKSLDAPQGLTWLNRFAFNNTYTLLARQELTDEGIQTLEDLAVYMNANDDPLTICVEGEFYARPDGLDGLQALYGFAFTEENIFVVETADVYEKLRKGECDVAEGFSTDGRIAAWGLVTLADTLAFFPFYNPAPVVRQEVLDLHPELTGLLNRLSGLLDEAAMAELNAQVDLGPDGELASGDESTVEDAAYNFLRAHRLIALPEIVVAAADATEGFDTIVSEMLKLVIADAGYAPVDRTDLGGHLVVRNAMVAGEVDIYLETVVTALAEYHGLPVAALPTTRERAYALAQNLDRENDIIWLDLLPYAETTAIIEGDELVDLGIGGLDDLALYMIANDSPLSICMAGDFYGSEQNGIEALQQLYGFEFNPDNILLMEEGDLLQGLETGECDVAAANSLDAAARGYTVLDDPLGFFLVSGSAPVIRKSVLDKSPELADIVNSMVALLDADTVGGLDRQVELGADGIEDSGDEAEAYDVAVDFLVDKNLIAPPPVTPVGDEAANEQAADEVAAPSSASDEETAAPGEGSTEETSAETSPEATPTEEIPAEPTPAEGEGGGQTGQAPAPVDSPRLTQSNPSAESTVRTSASSVGGNGAVNSGAPFPLEERPAGIVVASMADTEQQLMGTMLMTMLRSAGYPVVDQLTQGTSPDLRAMLEEGQIDLYPEFTGVALSLYHNIPPSALPTTADGAFSLVQDLDEQFNLVWIRKASFDSTYGLALSPAVANDGLATIVDLAMRLKADPFSLTLCIDDDFLNDTELGLAALTELYEFQPSPENTIILSADAIYRSLRDGTCDVGRVLQTDGRVRAWGLTVLADPLGAFPNYSPAPVVRKELLDRYPELANDLSALGPALTPAIITTLNAQVELGADGEPATGDEIDVMTVATSFLCDNALIDNCAAATGDTIASIPDIDEREAITPVLTLIPITENAIVTTTAAADVLATAAVAATVNTGTQTAQVESANTAPVATVAITVSTPTAFGVNARESADATATVVAILPRSTTVEAVGRTADSSWVRIVTDDGNFAWVFTAAVVTNPDRIAQLPVEPSP